MSPRRQARWCSNAQFDNTKDPYPLSGLAPGQSAQIDVSYAPVVTSTDKGTLFIKSNGGQGKTLQIPLSGSGLNVPPCQFVVAPSQLNFANVQVGDTSLEFLSLRGAERGHQHLPRAGAAGHERRDERFFHILSTSIPADATTKKITIPAPGPGVVSSLTVSLDFAPTAQGQGVLGRGGLLDLGPDRPQSGGAARWERANRPAS